MNSNPQKLTPIGTCPNNTAQRLPTTQKCFDCPSMRGGYNQIVLLPFLAPLFIPGISIKQTIKIWHLAQKKLEPLTLRQIFESSSASHSMPFQSGYMDSWQAAEVLLDPAERRASKILRALIQRHQPELVDPKQDGLAFDLAQWETLTWATLETLVQQNKAPETLLELKLASDIGL